MTTQNAAPQRRADHPTWWRIPLVASALGLPVLALEYSAIRAQAGMGQYGAVLYWALALYAVAWAPPHRRSFRTLRILASGAALTITLMPVTLLLLLGAMLPG
ncbi:MULTISPECIES: hypothetical protein [unclassified Streptomyces]|uniref:hypothetical protein n=1 Tax=unclassified Streptomyces TaxID=2593676 RepID=UPI001165AE7F|nr:MULTISPECIES: hypothetical protein [unclassified Streptomyces]NMI54568.1 hypothetical protein [Streptomyces sp. RLA2-12]QDN62873.1 hypothetical protein FNV67_53730 [Streptomyces sp. S1D4-20]QDN72927.1 hypothetical protein FNV66_52605 [Streptomyces sp. S1D4-14]QDO55450.1 hypothetical protein FNV60_51465 [Streptomyces sp. RLB3-5]QDO65627.1 hypothetical protein FNV59_53305 [Streptomyces sp. RLB1-8]